jgi:hypothetical protein
MSGGVLSVAILCTITTATTTTASAPSAHHRWRPLYLLATSGRTVATAAKR